MNATNYSVEIKSIPWCKMRLCDEWKRRFPLIFHFVFNLVEFLSSHVVCAHCAQVSYKPHFHFAICFVLFWLGCLFSLVACAYTSSFQIKAHVIYKFVSLFCCAFAQFLVQFFLSNYNAIMCNSE